MSCWDIRTQGGTVLTRPKYSHVLITARDPGFDTSSSHSGQKTGYTSRLETTLSQNLASLASLTQTALLVAMATLSIERTASTTSMIRCTCSRIIDVTMCGPEVASPIFAAVFARFFRSEINYEIHAIVHARFTSVKIPWRRK